MPALSLEFFSRIPKLMIKSLATLSQFSLRSESLFLKDSPVGLFQLFKVKFPVSEEGMLSDHKVVYNNGQSEYVNRRIVFLAFELFRRVVCHRSAPQLGLHSEWESKLDAKTKVSQANVVRSQRFGVSRQPSHQDVGWSEEITQLDISVNDVALVVDEGQSSEHSSSYNRSLGFAKLLLALLANVRPQIATVAVLYHQEDVPFILEEFLETHDVLVPYGPKNIALLSEEVLELF